MSERRTPRRRPSALLPFLFGLALVAGAGPAAAAETQVPGVGEVGEGIAWTGSFDPQPLLALDSVAFDARGVVEDEAGRLIGSLAITSNGGDLVLSARFPAIEARSVRVALLDGPTPVAEVTVEVSALSAQAAGFGGVGSLAGPSPGEVTAPARATGDVTVLFASPPATLPAAVTAALYQHAGFAGASGEAVPAPMFEVDLGARRQVLVGGESHQATTLRFLADAPFPPPGSSSAVLQRVEVFARTFSGGAQPPEISLAGERIDPGVLFTGVPVLLLRGRLLFEVDARRDTIVRVGLHEDAEGTPPRVSFLTGDAAGLAARWEAGDLAAGPPGSSIDLAAVGQNVASVEVRGVVAATRTAEGWDLSFQPPGGLAGVPRTVEVDGEAVGEVTVPAPSGVFARSGEPPSGAAVFPIGLGEGAFYGFSWDEPVAIEVPGAGTFTGREVRVVFPQPIGPLAFAGLSVAGLSRVTLTGLAAPAAADGGPCFASDTRLCLAGGRFAVEVAWADRFGGSGLGVARPLTPDTGTFWFFDEDNLELMVKVLAACTVDGRYWVFAGGLTDVEVELTVTDTRTERERTYHNRQGEAFQPIQDTAAFLCGP